jgi:hypothetical protein
MVELDSEPNHHRDEYQVCIKDGLSMVGGDHGKGEHPILAYEVRG